jgi:hypothetical protein
MSESTGISDLHLSLGNRTPLLSSAQPIGIQGMRQNERAVTMELLKFLEF